MNNFKNQSFRIVIDLQGFQRSGNRVRGIGRFSLELVKSLIYNYPDNEYILFANSSLYDLRIDFIKELKSKELNVIYFEWSPAADINNDISELFSKTWIATQLRSYALSIVHADIILLTSFFDGFNDNTLVDFDLNYSLPPTISLVYDLIPLIHSKTYLEKDEEYKEFYYKKIHDLKKLDALLTISESSKQEIQKYTEFKSHQVFNISAACNINLFNYDKTKDYNSYTNIKNFGEYFLYTGAIDPRKNLYFLLEAYSMLPLHLSTKHKLVLVGPFSEKQVRLIKIWVNDLKISFHNIVILGFVSDTFLVNLYRNCYLFIFPSLHEGFGLPVLEAMNCGAPVITSSSSSLPEILMLESAVFDPYDIDNLTELLIKTCSDRNFYNLLQKNSEDRKNYFSWQLTASKTIKAIRDILGSKLIQINNNRSIDLSIDFNKTSYQLLISNLKLCKILNTTENKNNKYIKRVCSAIDLLNDQSKKLPLIRTDNIKNLNWRIEGPFDSNYSLSILNRNFALAMATIGQNVSLHSTEGPGDFLPSQEFLSTNSIVNELYQKSINPVNNCLIKSRNLYPPRVSDLDAIINLLHAYGWEETSFPQDWVEDFNNYLDGITVMSNQVKKILIDNGVCLPIQVCGLGVDHLKDVSEITNYLILKKSYSFLHISSCFPRKGTDTLLKAFGDSFTIDDDVSLIIKTFANPHNDVHKLLAKYKKNNNNFPHVVVIEDNLTDSEINFLYQECDALVAPSFAEGFNLPLAEAMNKGIPVITTAWGGQMDFCNSNNAWLVDYQFEYAKTHFNLFSSVWARPSSKHLAQIMQEVHCSSDDLILSKVQLAREDISRFQWTKVSERNVEFVDYLINNSIKKSVKIGWVSTWDTRCGVATYSEHLISQLKDEVLIFAPKTNQKNKNKVIRCWTIGEDNLDLLLTKILENKITTLVLQFNYGFFEFSSFSNFISRIYEQNIKIIIFLHSTTDPLLTETKKLKDLSDTLSLCHRLLVHSPSDLNRLKSIGLVDNVSLFPHGILDVKKYSKKVNIIKENHKKFHFSTYGFCLPNKGFPELIKAIALLHKDDFKCRLTLHTALYDSHDSLVFYQNLLSLIDNLKLKNYIKINTSFCSDKDTLKKLSRTDLVIFPYQLTNESASGAVRQAISSSTPVAVTPLSIFEDVLDVVYRLPGCSPSLIAQGLKNWSDNCFGNPMTTKEKEWRKQHSFKKLGYRLQNLIRSIELNY